MTPTTGTVIYHTVSNILAFVYVAVLISCVVYLVKQIFGKHNRAE